MTEVCFDLSGDHFAGACRRQQQGVEARAPQPQHASEAPPQPDSNVAQFQQAVAGDAKPKKERTWFPVRSDRKDNTVFLGKGADLDAIFGAKPE